MKSGREVGETEGKVLDGKTILLPTGFLDSLGVKPGTRIHLRIANRMLGKRLANIGVTEEEIEAISLLQLEPRENVERFLATEGALRRWSGRRVRR